MIARGLTEMWCKQHLKLADKKFEKGERGKLAARDTSCYRSDCPVMMMLLVVGACRALAIEALGIHDRCLCK